jgi:hypothetical protein
VKKKNFKRNAAWLMLELLELESGCFYHEPFVVQRGVLRNNIRLPGLSLKFQII